MAMNWQVLFGVSGFRGITKMENQMDQHMDNEMETEYV